MKRRHFLSTVGGACSAAALLGRLPALEAAGSTEPPRSRLPGLTYFPEGDAIVAENGTRWDNRPLYCHERFTLIMAGEQPGLSGPMGRLFVGVARGRTRLLAHQFEHRVARYRPGRMEWEMTDPRLPGVTVRLVGTTLAAASGCAARLSVDGVMAGDMAGWFIVPPIIARDLEGGVLPMTSVGPTGSDDPANFEYRAQRLENGFIFDRVPAKPLAQIQGRFSAPVTQWERASFRGPESLLDTAPFAGDLLKSAALVAWVPLVAGTPQSIAVVADEDDPKSFGVDASFGPLLVRRTEPLDVASIADAAIAFDQGLARASALGRRVVVDTPDPHFNAAVGAAVAATFGLFVNPCFVHGGSSWRIQFIGWRTMGAAIDYGFHDQVRRCVNFWDTLQVKRDERKTQAEYSENGCQQAGHSRFLGAGFIDYKQPPHYEFQTQFFDEAIRGWRATADPALEQTLLPMLELHLTRCLECFDPDGDGLYESYNNTWPNDSVWYNGAGTVEESAYVYYGRRAAAEMRRRKGDLAAAATHDAIADKIKSALNRVLWLPERGHYAASIEQGGHRRVHSDAWIYSQHLPIEAGMSTPQQAWQAMYYTEWAMERFPLAFGGEMRQTSNFVPGQWSIRETYGGDNFAMALGYFLAGQGDDGWSLLRGTMLHSMYGDPKPMMGYSNEKGAFGQANLQSPGGLSQPNCGIDFNDITTMFGRAVVEGVFGYKPDYPNQTVQLAPALPAAWDHASIQAPDFQLAYRQEGAVDTYRIGLTRVARIVLRAPVRARRVKSVTVNGQLVTFAVQPWAGCGMLELTLPQSREAVVAIALEERLPQAPEIVVEKSVGERLDLDARQGTLRSVLDPQRCIESLKVSGSKALGRCAAMPGQHLLLLETAGEVPRYQLAKLRIVDPEGEARAAAKSPREAPAGARWSCLDLSSAFNGDIRAIYKQQYRSPRPNTCSMRVGYDGWSAWTFKWWGIQVPEIRLDGLAKLTGPDGRLRTPQNVEFAHLEEAKNVAFTSLWDNWPHSVTVPVDAVGDSIWLLVSGSTNPMQLRIANAVLRFQYADGQVETLDLVPPENFWSLCRFGRMDYNYERDGFALPKVPPSQVSLGENCRAMVYGWKLRPGVKLASVTLETLSQEVVIGLMGVSVMNPNERRGDNPMRWSRPRGWPPMTTRDDHTL